MIVVSDVDSVRTDQLKSLVDAPTDAVTGFEALRHHLAVHGDVDVVVLGPALDGATAMRFATDYRATRPSLGVVLVRSFVDATVLTEALRAGVREVVAESEPHELAAAVRRASDLAQALRERTGAAVTDEAPEGVLTVVFSAKGGCGKTTLATNLAAALADGGRREVCLVDLDLAFGDVAIAMQLFPSHTLADAVPMGENIDETAVSALLTPHSPGLTTLVAPVEPGSAEHIPASTVAAVLKVLKRRFNFVVVDTPPAFTDHVLAAVDEADLLALLTTLDIPALKNLKLTLETLDLLNYDRDRWRIVLNRADSKVGLGADEVEKTLRMPIAVQIPSSRAVPASINKGVPMVIDEPAHPVSQAVKSFAETHVAPRARASRVIPAELRSDRRRLFGRKAKTP